MRPPARTSPSPPARPGGVLRQVLLAAALVPALALVLASPGALRAQQLYGVVLYSHSDLPVGFATVSLVGLDGRVLASAFTRADGRFALDVPADGAYSVHVEHLTAFAMVDGPLRLSTSASTLVTFHLVPQPIALDEIEVTVEGRSLPLLRTGFYERERQGLGVFLDPREIERRRPVRTSDLLRAIPGVRFVEGRTAGFSGFPIMSYALRSQIFGEGSAPCYPRVLVDGVVVEQGGRQTPFQSFDEIVSAYDVGGMEIYRSPAETPAQLTGLAACGVILLWTKSGLGR